MHPVYSTAAALPYELYSEIVENLHPPSDRATLLSLSLVSKAWSAQGQRILHMEFCDEWSGDHDKKTVLARHTRFLCTITDHPTRIGPLVRTYAQFDLASAVGNGNSLRRLTIEALPAMVNLQHLHIVPVGGGSMPPNLFEHCTFQLRSLTLLFGLALSGPFLDFLRTQPDIRHLCIAPSVIWPCEADLSRLPEDVCPNLLSTSCVYESMAQVTEGRCVTALDTMVDFDSMQRRQLDPYRLDFGQVKYLSLRVQAGGHLRDPGRIVGNDIILLKLEVLNVEATANRASLWHLPNLRILVLIDGNKTSTKTSFRLALTESFSCLPKLEYVFIDDPYMDRTASRFSIIRCDVNRGALQLRCEQIRLQCDNVKPWWCEYENV